MLTQSSVWALRKMSHKPAVFLASGEAGWITGVVLDATGAVMVR
jgi:hypothetical protein